MAIDLATEVSFTPEAGQLPGRDRLGPVPRTSRSRSRWATPPRFPPRPPWRPGSSGSQHPPSGRRRPGHQHPARGRGPVLERRLLGGAAARPRPRPRSPRPGPRPARRPSAAPVPTSACSIRSPSPPPPPVTPCTSTSPRSRRVRSRVPEEAAFVIVHSEAPRLLSGTPYATRRAECERAAHMLGRPLGACELGDLSALADPVLRRRARHVVTECARVGEAERLLARGNLRGLGEVMTEGHRSLAGDYRVSRARRRRAGRAPLRPARRPRGPHERRRVRRVRHRAVRTRLARARSRGPRPAPRLAGQPGCRRSCVLRRSNQRIEHARRPGHCRPIRPPGSRPLSRSSGTPRHEERGRGVEEPDVTAGALLTLEHGRGSRRR